MVVGGGGMVGLFAQLLDFWFFWTMRGSAQVELAGEWEVVGAQVG